MGKDKLDQYASAFGHALLTASPQPVWIIDPGTLRIAAANAAAERLYGYSCEEFLQLSLEELCPEREREAIQAAIRQGLQRQQDTFESLGTWHFQKKDGGLLDIEVTGRPVRFGAEIAYYLSQVDVTTHKRIEAALQDSEAEFRAIFEQAAVGISLGSPDGRFDRVNQKCCEILGYTAEELAQLHIDQVTYPADREPTRACHQRILTGAINGYAMDKRYVRKDGTVIWAHVTVSLKRIGNAGTPDHFIAVIEDITQRRQMEDALRKSEANLATAQEIAHLGSWELDLVHRTVNWSDELYRIFGLDPGTHETHYDLILQIIHPEDRPEVERLVEQAIQKHLPLSIDHRVILPNGEIRTVHAQGRATYDQAGNPIQLIGTSQDITARKQTEQQIERLAFYDGLTGLPNRTQYRKVLEEVLATGQATSEPFALLNMELVRFSDINYTLGHSVGDQLLQQVGDRLQRCLSGGARVARIGNVQFAMILPGADAVDARAMAERILAGFRDAFPVGNITYELGVHIGIALFPGHGSEVEVLNRRADIARHQARQQNQGYIVYDPARDPYKPQRLALLGEFRKAIGRGDIRLYCQPKASLRTGKITSAEALVRWVHPEFGLIPPDQFIPLIEPTDLVHLLTQWVIEASISRCYQWRQEGLQLPLAVNLSTRNLLENHFSDTLSALLQTWGAEENWLGLEITESSLMTDPVASRAVLDQLSQMGFKLYVDDFGTGYSSLSYLMNLPVNVIKIDHSFTMNMIQDRQAAAIVKSTIEMAHNLGMHVVAEGTASQEIWEALTRLDCDEAQGHFISPPIPADQLSEWLSHSPWRPAH